MSCTDHISLSSRYGFFWIGSADGTLRGNSNITINVNSQVTMCEIDWIKRFGFRESVSSGSDHRFHLFLCRWNAERTLHLDEISFIEHCRIGKERRKVASDVVGGDGGGESDSFLFGLFAEAFDRIVDKVVDFLTQLSNLGPRNKLGERKRDRL